MRVKLGVVVVAACTFSTTTALATTNEQKAVQAVKQEIGRLFPLLDTSPAADADHARATVTCQTLTSKRYTCDWTATAKQLHERASGSARVIVYPGGGQAMLYNVTCVSPTGTC